MIPGLFAFGQYDATRSFLNYLKKSNIVMVVVLMTSTMHFFWCYYFIILLDLSVKGAAIATTFTYTLNLVIMTIFTCF